MKRCKIGQPICSSKINAQVKESIKTYQSHDLTNGSFYVEDLSTLDPDGSSLASELGEQNVRPISLHDLAYFVEPIEKDAIDLLSRDKGFFDIAFCIENQFAQLFLGNVDRLRTLTSNVNIIFTPALCTWRSIAIDPWKRRWKVNGSVCCSLNKTDVFSGAAANNPVKR